MLLVGVFEEIDSKLSPLKRLENTKPPDFRHVNSDGPGKLCEVRKMIWKIQNRISRVSGKLVIRLKRLILSFNFGLVSTCRRAPLSEFWFFSGSALQAAGPLRGGVVVKPACYWVYTHKARVYDVSWMPSNMRQAFRWKSSFAMKWVFRKTGNFLTRKTGIFQPQALKCHFKTECC